MARRSTSETREGWLEGVRVTRGARVARRSTSDTRGEGG